MVGIEGLNRIVSRIKQWVVDEISDHAGVDNAHHEPYTDAEVDAIVATHTAIAGAHHEPYTDAEVDAIVATHTAIAGAHHEPYTDAEAVTAMGAKADANPLHHDKMVVDAVHVQNYQEGTIDIASGVVVPLDFDNDFPLFQHAVVEYDYGGMYDNSNSERITCKKAGLYLVIAKIYWSFNANGSYRGIYFYKNGVYLTGDSPGPHQSGGFFQTVMIPVSLAVNDYLSLKVYQDSGAIISIYYGYYYTGLWATLLREF